MVQHEFDHVIGKLFIDYLVSVYHQRLKISKN
ncbi:hypothetical protein HOG21_06805 [bacterium]|nr:hypothetical protein [bacterium]